MGYTVNPPPPPKPQPCGACDRLGKVQQSGNYLREETRGEAWEACKLWRLCMLCQGFGWVSGDKPARPSIPKPQNPKPQERPARYFPSRFCKCSAMRVSECTCLDSIILAVQIGNAATLSAFQVTVTDGMICIKNSFGYFEILAPVPDSPKPPPPPSPPQAETEREIPPLSEHVGEYTATFIAMAIQQRREALSRTTCVITNRELSEKELELIRRYNRELELLIPLWESRKTSRPLP